MRDHARQHDAIWHLKHVTKVGWAFVASSNFKPQLESWTLDASSAHRVRLLLLHQKYHWYMHWQLCIIMWSGTCRGSCTEGHVK